MPTLPPSETLTDSMVMGAAGLLFLLLAFGAARLQGQSLGRALGFDVKKLWWYRDLALAVIGWVSSMWGMVLLLAQPSHHEVRVAVVCLALAGASCLVSPNRLLVFTIVVGGIAMQGWFAVIFWHDLRAWAVAVSATLVELAILALFRKRPVQEK